MLASSNAPREHFNCVIFRDVAHVLQVHSIPPAAATAEEAIDWKCASAGSPGPGAPLVKLRRPERVSELRIRCSLKANVHDKINKPRGCAADKQKL